MTNIEGSPNAWMKNEEIPEDGGITHVGGRDSGTIHWGEKGELPNYRETNFVILVCVRNDSLTVEGGIETVNLRAERDRRKYDTGWVGWKRGVETKRVGTSENKETEGREAGVDVHVGIQKRGLNAELNDVT